MSGKELKVASNDLYGNVDDRLVRMYACFEHTKYMNNYAVFSFNGDMSKLCFGSVHLKDKSIVVFSVKDNIKKYILNFLDEYMSSELKNFKILDIEKMSKIEVVSYNEMVYDDILKLDEKSLPKVEEIVEVKEKKPVLVYLLIFILILLALGISLLYFKPELFTVKYKVLVCDNNVYDNNFQMYYNVEKNIGFNSDDKVESVDVVRTYTFLDKNSYYSFKDREDLNQYFNNGESYNFRDEELKFKLMYKENSVIDDYDEMLTYLKREGFSCVVYEYEK